MELNEIDFGSALPIDGYGPGFFRVAGEVIDGPILCAGSDVSGWRGVEDLAPLEALAGQIDVLLLGMGKEIAPVPGELRRKLEAAGIGVEPMATGSAARTYNVLLSEGRRIAAALVPV